VVQTAVTFYDVVLWVHVSSVVVAFGPPFAYGVWIAIASRDDPESIPFVYRVLQRLDRSFVTIGGILILLTGMYLAADAWDFGYFFITWGLIAILVLLGLAHGFFLPNERRAERLARRDIEASTSGRLEFSREYNEVGGKLARVGPIAGLIVIVTIYVMVAKPFL
jgi:small-conductance mechanosensitive channel